MVIDSSPQRELGLPPKGVEGPSVTSRTGTSRSLDPVSNRVSLDDLVINTEAHGSE